MPKRLIKPAWNHIKSPVTVRGVLLFIAVVFLVYTFVTDFTQRQASYERYRAIVQYTEESRAALEATKRQNENFDQSLKNTTQLLQYMEQMTHSMQEVAEILKTNRLEVKQEHEAILKNQGAIARGIFKGRTGCWQLVPHKQKFGDTEVIVREFKRVPCK